VTERLRVALVGAGLAARSHALDIVTDDSLELAGVAGGNSSSASDLAGLFGGVVYPDLEALLSDPAVDGVIVAVPPSAVFDVLDRVAEAGTPCLAEKPVATCQEQLSRLERLVRCEAPVAAPFNRRYQPHVRYAASAMAALGEIAVIQASWSGPFRARFGEDSGTYRARARRREGVVTDSGAHALDAVSLLLGGMTAISVRTAALACNDRGADVEGRFTFDSGGVAVEVSLADTPAGPGCGEWQIRVRGSNACLCVDEHECVVQSQDGGGRQVTAAGTMDRPVSDLRALISREKPAGTALGELLAVSGLVSAVYDMALPGSPHWLRPRGKALGRLNGAC